MPTTVQGKKERDWAKKGSKTFWKKNRKNKKGSYRRKKNKNKAVIDQSPAGAEEGQPWINLEEPLQEGPPKLEFYPKDRIHSRIKGKTKVQDIKCNCWKCTQKKFGGYWLAVVDHPEVFVWNSTIGESETL